jgi:hypothetical protein
VPERVGSAPGGGCSVVVENLDALGRGTGAAGRRDGWIGPSGAKLRLIVRAKSLLEMDLHECSVVVRAGRCFVASGVCPQQRPARLPRPRESNRCVRDGDGNRQTADFA